MIRERILNNVWLKLASLVLATLIWLTVQANLEKETRLVYQTDTPADEMDRHAVPQRRFELPVVVRCNGTNYPSFRTQPTTVSVTVSGDAKKISAMESKEILVFVEAGDPPTARELCPVQVAMPPNVNWIRVLPNMVLLQPLPHP